MIDTGLSKFLDEHETLLGGLEHDGLDNLMAIVDEEFREFKRCTVPTHICDLARGPHSSDES